MTMQMAFVDDTQESCYDALWQKLYKSLQPIALHIVFSSGMVQWQGQEGDIAEDIVQETIKRLFEYTQKALRGSVSPIRSLEGFMIVIARNYCKDLIRRDRRLIHVSSSDYTGSAFLTKETESPSDTALENIEMEWQFVQIAQEVVRFPRKQQRALLIELASRMIFETELTSLQKAFLQVGICLKEYQQYIPATPAERTRHASLLSHAYKRLHSRFTVEKPEINVAIQTVTCV